jgi:hypothetical protein
VVEDEQVIIAGTLGSLNVVADHRGVRADLRLGKHHAEFHVPFSLQSSVHFVHAAAEKLYGSDASNFSAFSNLTKCTNVGAEEGGSASTDRMTYRMAGLTRAHAIHTRHSAAAVHRRCS